MGWFTEQIRQRAENDQGALEDAYFSLGSVIMEKWSADRLEDERRIAVESMDHILKYFHMKPVPIPETVEGPVRQVEYVLRRTGLMIREVVLEENWHTCAWGPMLGLIKETGAVVPLLPGKIFGYYYVDPATGRKVKITRKNRDQFSRSAMCFYRPLPMKKLGMTDLLLFMQNCVTQGDRLIFLLITLAAQLVGMLEPRIYSLITGRVMQHGNASLMAGLGIFLVTSAFAGQLIALARNLMMTRINVKTSQTLQSAVMMRILSLPVSFFRKYSSGELASRVQSINALCSIILKDILSVVVTSLMSLLYVAQIFSFAPSLVWPSLGIVLATAAVSLAVSVRQIGISRRRMKYEAEESGMVYAILNGIQKIRLAGSEKRMFARWARLHAKAARLEYNPPVFLKISGVITTAISLLGTVALYFLAVRTGVEVSQYYAFNAAYGRVMAAFTALTGIAASVASIRPVLEMAEPILKAEPEVTDGKKPVDQVTGRIEVSHVSFRYDENAPLVLNDLSLTVQAGEYVAIVGRTGCGKSTLVRLLLGFEKPESGSVFYDLHDLSTVDPRSLRRQIGVVIQNGQLIQGDIFSNITASAPDLSVEEAWEAAETAGIAQDIREMPMGMNTMIAEGQGGISGGQKQRLLIARAIAAKPRILIFDEATSALDNKTQKQVSDALDKLNCTRIVIAHRLSTVRNCDRILVMDQGAIIEEGSYEELIEKKGAFADLVARQRLDTGETAK